MHTSAPFDSHTTKNWHYTADYNMYQGENSNVHCFCRFEHCLQFFFVSEPDVASSDATNMECQITREGSKVVINGRKWWSSGKWKLSLNYQFHQLYCFSQRAGNITHDGPKEKYCSGASFECSQHRISSTDSKDRTTLFSIIKSTTVKCFSVAFIWMVTL